MPVPDSFGQWGILGGSFDPVHNGHLHIAESIRISKSLAGVLFVPAFNHPFKKNQTVAPYADRAEMLKLALENRTNLKLCEIENEENLSGFTIDTLVALKKRFPKTSFNFIIGLDLVSELKSWHRSEELLKKVHFLAGLRPGVDKTMISGNLNKSVDLVEIDEVNISASDIRSMIKRGGNIKDLKKIVPSKVADYIFEKGLYR